MEISLEKVTNKKQIQFEREYLLKKEACHELIYKELKVVSFSAAAIAGGVALLNKDLATIGVAICVFLLFTISQKMIYKTHHLDSLLIALQGMTGSIIIGTFWLMIDGENKGLAGLLGGLLSGILGVLLLVIMHKKKTFLRTQIKDLEEVGEWSITRMANWRNNSAIKKYVETVAGQGRGMIRKEVSLLEAAYKNEMDNYAITLEPKRELVTERKVVIAGVK